MNCGELLRKWGRDGKKNLSLAWGASGMVRMFYDIRVTNVPSPNGVGWNRLCSGFLFPVCHRGAHNVPSCHGFEHNLGPGWKDSRMDIGRRSFANFSQLPFGAMGVLAEFPPDDQSSILVAPRANDYRQGGASCSALSFLIYFLKWAPECIGLFLLVQHSVPISVILLHNSWFLILDSAFL